MTLISVIYISIDVKCKQIPGSNRFDSQMQLHTGNQNNDVCLAKEFQQHLKKEHRKNFVIDQGKYKKDPWNENGQTYSIMFRIMLLLHRNMLECIVTQINSQNCHFVVHIPNLIAQEVLVISII